MLETATKLPRVDRINERIPTTDLKRVVIIGGGFAGVELVKKLSKANVQIVLIDKNNHHSFIPLLYQVATAGLSPGDITNPLREFMQENKHFHFRMAKVKKILAAEKEVDTDLGVIKYDYLIIASGSKTNFFGNDDIRKKSLKLREVSDAIELRTRLISNFEEALQVEGKEELEKHMNVVIVGGGPTGVELAGAIGELRNQILPKDYPELDFSEMKIHLVEGMDRVLSGMSDKSGERAFRYLKKFGVDVKLGLLVKEYNDSVATLSDGSTIKTKCLIWAAGVTGNVIPGLHEEAVAKGRILVDEYNLVKGHKYIFAVGDVALQDDDRYPRGLPQLAPVALQQSRRLADNLIRLMDEQQLKPFRYVDKGSMATIGRNKAVVDAPFHIRLGGFIGWFVWMFVHLFSINGFRRKLLVFSNWIWNYFTYNRGNRLIINRDLDED